MSTWINSPALRRTSNSVVPSAPAETTGSSPAAPAPRPPSTPTSHVYERSLRSAALCTMQAMDLGRVLHTGHSSIVEKGSIINPRQRVSIQSLPTRNRQGSGRLGNRSPPLHQRAVRHRSGFGNSMDLHRARSDRCLNNVNPSVARPPSHDKHPWELHRRPLARSHVWRSLIHPAIPRSRHNSSRLDRKIRGGPKSLRYCVDPLRLLVVCVQQVNLLLPLRPEALSAYYAGVWLDRLSCL